TERPTLVGRQEANNLVNESDSRAIWPLQDLHKVAGCSVNGLIADECHVVSLDAIRLDKRLASRNRYSKSGCSIASFALYEDANCTLVAALRNSSTWRRHLSCEPHLWTRRDADRPTGLSRSSAT